ncbi:MAG: hypothetical protein R6W75_05445 [Smithellaceae bacterium]
MARIKKSITPLNVLLTIGVVIGLVYLTTVLTGQNGIVVPPPVSEDDIENQVRRSFEVPSHNLEIDVEDIERNVFHPDRKMTKRQILTSRKPKIILYGTFISDELQIAYVEDLMNPQVTSSGIQRQRAVQKGDVLSGYVVTEIYPGKVILTKNSEKLTLLFQEKKKIKPPEEPDVVSEPPRVLEPQMPKPQSQPSLEEFDRLFRMQGGFPKER